MVIQKGLACIPAVLGFPSHCSWSTRLVVTAYECKAGKSQGCLAEVGVPFLDEILWVHADSSLPYLRSAFSTCSTLPAYLTWAPTSKRNSIEESRSPIADPAPTQTVPEAMLPVGRRNAALRWEYFGSINDHHH